MEKYLGDLDPESTDAKKREYYAILRSSGVIARVSEILNKLMYCERPRNTLAFFLRELRGESAATATANHIYALELELEQTHREIMHLEQLLEQLTNNNNMPTPPLIAYDANGNIINNYN